MKSASHKKSNTILLHLFSSVDSLRRVWLFATHGLQHARLPCPSPTPGVCSNLCPLSRWCHPTISSAVVPFSSFLQSFPASGSFPMSQFFTSGGQIIGVSASASVLPMNIQHWFPLGLTYISYMITLICVIYSSQIYWTVEYLLPGAGMEEEIGSCYLTDMGFQFYTMKMFCRGTSQQCEYI